MAGNQTRAKRPDGSWQRFVYDAANRLVKVTNAAATVTYATYTYGAGNRRLVTMDAAQTLTYYGWAGGAVLAEYTEYAASPNQWLWQKAYIQMGGSLLASISPGGASESVEYHHPDRLGTRLTTNNLNTSSYEQATLPYGTALEAESTGATNRRFTSYDRSPSTGLDYALNRTYDSAQGRFTQVDPIGAGATDISDPQSWNMYAYCGNDPVNHVDPDGLFFKKLFRWIKKHWKTILIVAAAVALAILFSPIAPSVTKFLGFAAHVEGGLTAAAAKAITFGKIAASAALGVGTAARAVQESQNPDMSDDRNFPPENTIYIYTTVFRRLPFILASGTLGAVALSRFAFQPDAAHRSSNANPNPYSPCESYLGVNARFMYRLGGNGPWAQHVRQGLINERAANPNISMNAAHMRAYWNAAQAHPISVVPEFPLAVVAAGGSLHTQGLFTLGRMYVTSRFPNAAPAGAQELLNFPCLPVK